VTDHTRIYEIVQKVFNAGQEFERDILEAYSAESHGEYVPYPAAYPVITPLIEELISYANEIDRRSVVYTWLSFYITRIPTVAADDLRALLGPLETQVSTVRPSSPFRSVEIIDGKVNDA